MFQEPYCNGNMPPWQFQGNQFQPAWQPNLGQTVGQMPMSQQGPSVMGEMGQSPLVQSSANVPTNMSELPMEQSYIENILRLNRGKQATVYMSFDGSSSPYEPIVFKGIVEAAGRDHIVLSDPETGERYLLLMVFLNYVKFNEEIEYSYPFDQMNTYSPR